MDSVWRSQPPPSPVQSPPYLSPSFPDQDRGKGGLTRDEDRDQQLVVTTKTLIDSVVKAAVANLVEMRTPADIKRYVYGRIWDVAFGDIG